MSVTDTTSPSSLEDFLNIDLLTGAGSSSSPESSAHSPIFPPTPPLAFETEPSFFTFNIEDEFTKQVDSLAHVPSSAPYDFFGAFANYAALAAAAGASTSPSSSASPAALSAPAISPIPAPVLAIDPQLVDSPLPTTPAAPQDEDGEMGSDMEGDDGDDDLYAASPASSNGMMKAGGKGTQRKGTVVSGGIVKKSPRIPEAKKKDDTPDDWRPSPEEYKKMSSKEKRQLRNKISARNFRTRRKEYISTLEGDIAERDQLIDAIRSELGSTKSENIALREEINALKKALLSGSQGPVLPPPGPLPTVPAAITATKEKEAAQAAAAVARAASPALLTPNLHKDLPTSPRLAGPSRGFWGGSNSGASPFGSFTPVHTTLIPEFSAFANVGSVLSGKHAPQPPRSPVLQENINPALNGFNNVDNSNQDQLRTPLTSMLGANAHAFDSFADVNPFTLKTLDAYRMQLWGKMAAAQRAQVTHPHNTSAPMQSTPGLVGSLRPAYFTGSAKPLPITNGPNAGKIKVEEVQAVDALARTTLFSRMGSAFWDAFSGGNEASGSLDANKVRKVLEGKAVVRVVDVDEPAPKAGPAMPTLTPKLRTPSPAPPAKLVAPAPRRAPASANACGDMCSLTSILEESMRTLSISKKS